ncbi:hypothetical protein ACI01nite_24690 [Acetobacter cibinongensis]|nr:hypothetical protein [Acetobacter cibinongensis]GAN61661.1 hypothetical protein Abci_053_015 [Acetobacter cibinongensis]GEL59867.1 hypothetical protein ACI01nite_24690 [Acetobacter cibinongensis]
MISWLIAIYENAADERPHHMALAAAETGEAALVNVANAYPDAQLVLEFGKSYARNIDLGEVKQLW